MGQLSKLESLAYADCPCVSIRSSVADLRKEEDKPSLVDQPRHIVANRTSQCCDSDFTVGPLRNLCSALSTTQASCFAVCSHPSVQDVIGGHHYPR